MKSQKGFTPLGRDELKYTEDGRELIIYSELQTGNGRCLHADSIRNWLPPYDREPVTEEKKQEIVSMACEYLKARGYKVILKTQKRGEHEEPERG
jgi:hypothetical protein